LVANTLGYFPILPEANLFSIIKLEIMLFHCETYTKHEQIIEHVKKTHLFERKIKLDKPVVFLNLIFLLIMDHLGEASTTFDVAGRRSFLSTDPTFDAMLLCQHFLRSLFPFLILLLTIIHFGLVNNELISTTLLPSWLSLLLS
jgi:hypothetical protein